MVEFALILPVLMFLTLGMLEMGFAINHNVSIQTATRQGARVGSILVNGDPTGKCNTGNATAAATVDPSIISAVEGALTEAGSSVKKAQVTLIEIYGLSSNNAALGTDTFTYSTTTGHFVAGSVGWPAVGRCGAVTGTLPAGGAPRIGVRITYAYNFITPLGAVIQALGGTIFGNHPILMTDTTVMALEPPKP
jgi:Flp pilus assembly protein TadG